jgi:hypothetical protein
MLLHMISAEGLQLDLVLWLLYNKYVLYSTFPHKKKEARVSESSKLAK